MAIVLVALLVLVPIALLVIDLMRGGAKQTPFSGPSHARALGSGDGPTTRGPRPQWPTKPAPVRRDVFGDRSA